jgi:septal ring factor EnvC (AmiA/AmiB activator)
MAIANDEQDQLAAENTRLRAALALKSTELEKAQSTIAEQAAAIASLTEKYQAAQDRYEKLRRMHFGSTSEKQVAKDDSQPNLFDEAEAFTDGQPEESSDESEAAAPLAPSTRTRKKSGRKPLPANLPRE